MGSNRKKWMGALLLAVVLPTQAYELEKIVPQAAPLTVGDSVYIDSQGRQATVVYTLSVEGAVWCEPLVPYVNVGGTWTKTTTAQVSVGTDVTFGPQPTDGNWKWTGPNGYTYTGREARLGSFSADKAGAYTATRTNEAGCHESVTFTLTLK